MGLAVLKDEWKKCPVIVEHSYSTYNLARKAAIKKTDTGQDLDSEVTDREKGWGKRRVTKKRHFDDTDSEDYIDDPAIVLNCNKKKKTATISSDSDDDRESLPSAQITGVRERLKSLQRNASTSTNARTALSTQKNISVSDISAKENFPASSGPWNEKQIKGPFTKLTSSKNLSSIEAPDKTSSDSNISFIDDDRCIETSLSSVSNRSSPISLIQHNADLSLSKEKISKNFTLSRATDDNSNEKSPHLFKPQLKSIKDSGHKTCSTLHLDRCCDSPFSVTNMKEKSVPRSSDSDSIQESRKAHLSQPVYSISSVEVVKVELLQELNSKLDFIMIQNERVMKKLYPEEVVLKKPKDFPSLPLQSEDDFKNFEEFLQIENHLISTADFFYTLVSGCVLEHKAAGKLMRKCVSNRLSRMMSWDGTSNIKLIFNKSKLKQAIFCSLLKLYPGSKLLDAEAAIKRWLNTSAQRTV